MKLLFVRHGQTIFNRLGLCNGDPMRDVRLTATGIAQAQQVAERLGERRIDRVICSELPRTRQTAEIINRPHGAPISVHPDINDIRSGFEDRPVEDYQRYIAADRLHTRPPGGESLLEHKARVSRFLDWLESLPEQTVLVVAHEETLRVVIARYRRLSDAQMVPLRIGNCEILEFEPSETMPHL